MPNVNQKDTDNDGIGDVCDDSDDRITEKYTWLPWLGIGFAFVVIVVLMLLTITKESKNNGKEKISEHDEGIDLSNDQNKNSLG